jgi:eukaryotic-like serine/threonine-protein kinase
MTPPTRPPSPSLGAPEPGSASGTRRRSGHDGEADVGGRYRVISEIGRGGMASVHLSRMEGPGGFHKWVALKRIHPHLLEDDQLVEMFLDEARMAAGISHPNVAQVFDLGRDASTYWIAMEYLHGEPLRELLRWSEDAGQPVHPAIAARICADAAEGLHAAHELRGKDSELLGLVHRDVSPHNLFVTYDGYTKVVDFGIAKAAGRLASTRAGELKGKIAYMAPEQFRNEELDRTTDVFALGIVLWELTTNRPLFRTDNDLDTFEKVRACRVPPPSELVPDYPKALEEIVMTALEADRQHRFPTARAFARALSTFLRRQTFVGYEEVAELMHRVFADRLARRDAHLVWAAEVTGPIERPAAAALAEKARAHGMMEDDDEAATLIARNPSSFPATRLPRRDEGTTVMALPPQAMQVPTQALPIMTGPVPITTLRMEAVRTPAPPPPAAAPASQPVPRTWIDGGSANAAAPASAPAPAAAPQKRSRLHGLVVVLAILCVVTFGVLVTVIVRMYCSAERPRRTRGSPSSSCRLTAPAPGAHLADVFRLQRLALLAALAGCAPLPVRVTRGSGANEPPPARVAVLWFEGDAALAAFAVDGCIASVAEGRIDVAAKTRVATAAAAQGFAKPAELRPDQYQQLGKALEVDGLVVGALGPVIHTEPRERYVAPPTVDVLTARLVSSRTGEVMAEAEVHRGKGADGPTEVVLLAQKACRAAVRGKVD